MFCWFQSQQASVFTLLAGVGHPLEEYARYLGIRDGNLLLWMGDDNALSASAALPAADWHFVAATFDGVRVHLYADGLEVASGKLAFGGVSPNIQMAPDDLPWQGAQKFGGRIASQNLCVRSAKVCQPVVPLFVLRGMSAAIDI